MSGFRGSARCARARAAEARAARGMEVAFLETVASAFLWCLLGRWGNTVDEAEADAVGLASSVAEMVQ